MKRLFHAHIIAVALMFLVESGLQADPLPPESVAWTYNWSPGAPAVLADGNPSAGITFTNEPTKTAVGSSDIVATNLRVFSAATAAAPDVLKTKNGDYSLNLILATSENGKTYSKNLTFKGKLSGTFSAESANVMNTFTKAGPTKVVLGSYTFKVSLMSYTPPGPPDQSNAGSISAHVEVTNFNPADVPEPCTLALSGMALTLVGGAAWRKRRKARLSQTEVQA